MSNTKSIILKHIRLTADILIGRSYRIMEMDAMSGRCWNCWNKAYHTPYSI